MVYRARTHTSDPITPIESRIITDDGNTGYERLPESVNRDIQYPRKRED